MRYLHNSKLKMNNLLKIKLLPPKRVKMRMLKISRKRKQEAINNNKNKIRKLSKRTKSKIKRKILLSSLS